MIRQRNMLLHDLDHSAVLAACREMMADPTGYRTMEYSAGLDLRDHNIPAIIRDLGPAYVGVGDTFVQIEMHGGFNHFGLRAFAEGVEGGGNQKLIEGLWFYHD
jgi:hypothetical protein